jgi:hypothetical protein
LSSQKRLSDRFQFVIPTDNFPLWFLYIGRLSQFVRWAKKAGATGIRFRPTRNVLGIQVLLGLLGKDMDSILCTESSFRSERWPWQWLTMKGWYRKGLALFAYLFSPYLLEPIEDSIWGLRRLWQVMGNALPATLYPNPFGKKQPTRINLWEMLVQLSPSMLEACGSVPPAQLPDRLEEMGFTGVTLDLMHLFRCESWTKLLPIFLDKVGEIHIPMLRPDFNETEQEIKDLWYDIEHGTQGSPLLYIFLTVLRTGWTGRIVLEGSDIKEISLEEWHRRHSVRIEQLKRFLDKLPPA